MYGLSRDLGTLNGKETRAAKFKTPTRAVVGLSVTAKRVSSLSLRLAWSNEVAPWKAKPGGYSAKVGLDLSHRRVKSPLYQTTRRPIDHGAPVERENKPDDL